MANQKFPIKAVIRIRPGNSFLEYTKTSVKVEKENGVESEFFFDRVLGPTSTQSQVFRTIKEELGRFKEGYNTTIFCYGNTGAGKTHTMIGSKKQPGLIYNILGDLFEDSTEQIAISYLEIYNEKVYDLLEPKELQLREAEGVIVVQGMCLKKVSKVSEFDDLFSKGLENRTTGETKLNKFSSRSHSILRIQRGEAKLHLIDLAGSENNRKTGNEGLRLMESNNINRSLFVLGKVVNSILNKETRIPYRDSKLTRLLQDSLGGSSVCCIIANVNDDEESVGDTINTLSFASKSKKIINTGISKCSKGTNSTKLQNSTKINSTLQKNTSTNLLNTSKLQNSTKLNFSNSTTPLANKTNIENNIKKRKKDNSTLILGSSFYGKPDIVLTPRTKEKSYTAFLNRAREFESTGHLKEALDDYKTIQKFNESSFVESKIEELSRKLKSTKKKIKVSLREVLDILNSGNFVNIKRISCIGDKRAQSIVDFVAGGNFFESLDDLKLIFSEKVVSRIVSYVE
ncbi:Kinesin-like protein KIF22 [Nosema granulosis]|uniref:Kinesin-like protein n=1 Tax=Nosema granulosis TaxID=83296 RepID=A0A9P6KYZ0_9MICR|nr:Kinesin-like protein KIF22 [Nosema granulosis]